MSYALEAIFKMAAMVTQTRFVNTLRIESLHILKHLVESQQTLKHIVPVWTLKASFACQNARRLSETGPWAWNVTSNKSVLELQYVLFR